MHLLDATKENNLKLTIRTGPKEAKFIQSCNSLQCIRSIAFPDHCYMGDITEDRRSRTGEELDQPQGSHKNVGR